MPEKKYFRGHRKMGYRESLYFCGCKSCINSIKTDMANDVPTQTGFLEYVAETYPTAYEKAHK